MKRVVVFSAGLIVGGLLGGLLFACVGELMAVLPRMRRARVDTLAVASRLLVLVGSGLTLVPALSAAAGGVPEIEVVVRRWRRLGGSAALSSASGPLAPLLHRLGEAAASGSAPEPAIRGFIEAERRLRHTVLVERARRLPVRMMVPMTLLVLPGFVLMVYGPTFLGLVSDLVGPLAG